jgi:glutaconate CoA-transferase subunit A
MSWGILGSSKEAVFAAKKVIVTVEEIVDEFTPHHSSTIIPEKLITALAVAPRGAWPSYASGYYERDNDQYIAWDEISKERESFENWLQTEVYAKGNA